MLSKLGINLIVLLLIINGNSTLFTACDQMRILTAIFDVFFFADHKLIDNFIDCGIGFILPK